MTFEYKNSRLSVVEGAPEKPQFATYVKINPNYQSANEQFTAALEAYESALASCRRIPVADEDQNLCWALIERSIAPGGRVDITIHNQKEGELYHVDIEVEIVPVKCSKWCGGFGCLPSGTKLYITNKSKCSGHPTDKVARIKQPEGATIYNHPIYGASVGTGSYNREKKPVVASTEDQEELWKLALHHSGSHMDPIKWLSKHFTITRNPKQP